MDRLELNDDKIINEIHPAILNILNQKSDNRKLTVSSINSIDNFRRRQSNLSTKSTKGLKSKDLPVFLNKLPNKRLLRSDIRRKTIYISSEEITNAKLEYNFECLDSLLTKKRKRSKESDNSK
jgi:hypothetical protein